MTPTAHRHRWSVVDFFLEADRPMVAQRCLDCGAQRRIRAWDRTWTPPSTATADRD